MYNQVTSVGGKKKNFFRSGVIWHYSIFCSDVKTFSPKYHGAHTHFFIHWRHFCFISCLCRGKEHFANVSSTLSLPCRVSSWAIINQFPNFFSLVNLVILATVTSHIKSESWGIKHTFSPRLCTVKQYPNPISIQSRGGSERINLKSVSSYLISRL